MSIPSFIVQSATPDEPNHKLIDLFRNLLDRYGPQGWWPADTDEEMVVGAYLTQNTSWRNVELALDNLRSAGALSLRAIHALNLSDLEAMIRPSGFYRQKASRLQRFAAFVESEGEWDLSLALREDVRTLRPKLLALPGVGPETADCILLYAARQPVFVVDAYTRRLFAAEQIFHDAQSMGYEDLRARVETAFRAEFPDCQERTHALNEFHALIVAEGKERAKSKLYNQNQHG